MSARAACFRGLVSAFHFGPDILGETGDYRKLSEGWQTVDSICPENIDGPVLKFWFMMAEPVRLACG